MLKGIDVSGYQGNIDWKKAKADGIKFAILKLGNIYDSDPNDVDSKFERNYEECIKNDVYVGIYVYNYCNSIGALKKGVKHVIDKLKGRKLDLPIYLDMEDKTLTSEGKAVLTEQCNEFAKLVQAENYRAGVYANANWFKNYIDISKLNKNVSIWVAQYEVNKPQVENPDIWQYSSSGKVSGINSDRVDMNYLYNESIINNDGEIEEEKQENKKLKYKVGDKVSYNKIYSSSTSTTALTPVYTSGKITKIYKGTRNPYLIGNGTGFVNDDCIISNSNSSTASSKIKVGDKVKILNAVQYNGQSFAKYYDNYDVIEIKGNRVVIGKGKTVTCAINIKNIQKI